MKDNTEIEIITDDDESLKTLGELLSNKSSRDLIKFLMNKSTYKKKIADELEMPFSLVEHHLKKLEKLGLVKITNKRLVKGGMLHKNYKINADGIFITFNTKEEINEKGILKKIFKEGIKFLTVTIAVITTWFSTNQQIPESKISLDKSVYIVNKTAEISQPDIPSSYHPFVVEPIISVSVIIICCSLFLIWFSRKYK